MLNKEQLQQISASVEDALQVAADERGQLLHHLLEIASLEVCRLLKVKPGQARKAA